MKCPTCEKLFEPHSEKHMPFCSARCQTIDLGRWLGEDYGLPHIPDPEADEKPDAPWDTPEQIASAKDAEI
ncbi:DNA gyrase inhibitor YacG [Adhaeretor mobilis]|uniref:Zinc-binding protein n=1 Tax=Adhaeretor mobilis TaxID=1930276 RepID=A0A517MVU7_9BACT|nr:DNA gyrase inhibitor YacG [Adhaeretor mobilis]QDS98917.1 zinc-binding protein [Adhaeretor mobilis]